MPAARSHLQYAGEFRTHSLGAYDLRARDYDAGTGRFRSQDPTIFGPGDTTDANLFLYGSANPVYYTDPTGLAVYVATIKAMAIKLTLGSTASSVAFNAFSSAMMIASGASWQAGLRAFATDMALDGVTGGIGSKLKWIARAVPETLKLRRAGEAIKRAKNSVWNIRDAGQRGRAIEKKILNDAGVQERVLHPDFPVLDHLDPVTGTGLSIKSYDLFSGYSKSGAIRDALRSDVRRLSQAVYPKSYAYSTVGKGEVRRRTLVAAFEDGAMTSAQLDDIAKFADELRRDFPGVHLVVQFIK